MNPVPPLGRWGGGEVLPPPYRDWRGGLTSATPYLMSLDFWRQSGAAWRMWRSLAPGGYHNKPLGSEYEAITCQSTCSVGNAASVHRNLTPKRPAMQVARHRSRGQVPLSWRSVDRSATHAWPDNAAVAATARLASPDAGALFCERGRSSQSLQARAVETRARSRTSGSLLASSGVMLTWVIIGVALLQSMSIYLVGTVPALVFAVDNWMLSAPMQPRG